MYTATKDNHLSIDFLQIPCILVLAVGDSVGDRQEKGERMPKQKRHNTKYPGVTYIVGQAVSNSRPEKLYYIRYRRGGKLVEELAGRQFQHAMTPAKAANIRAERIEGKEKSNSEKREQIQAEKEAFANRWTLQRLWDDYQAQRPESYSKRVDENRFRLYIADAVSDKLPEELVPLDIDRLRIKLGKTLSPQTVKHALALIVRTVNHGHRKNICNPLSFGIRLPKVNNEETEDLTPEQMRRLLDTLEHAANRPIADMLLMVLFCGLRRGELCKLRWDDIDRQRKFIILRDPKGGRDQRVPLNQSAEEVLLRQPKPRAGLIFPGRNGEQRKQVTPQARKLLDQAGIPRSIRPFHGLRHTYASMLASSGKVDLYTLQKLLTHKSAKMTQRYAHLRDEALRNASDIAGDLINSSITKKDNSKAG
jgi:integrase